MQKFRLNRGPLAGFFLMEWLLALFVMAVIMMAVAVTLQQLLQHYQTIKQFEIDMNRVFYQRMLEKNTAKDLGQWQTIPVTKSYNFLIMTGKQSLE